MGPNRRREPFTDRPPSSTTHGNDLIADRRQHRADLERVDLCALKSGAADQRLSVVAQLAALEDPTPRSPDDSLKHGDSRARRRGDMFDGHKAPARTEDPAYLTEDSGTVGHRAENERRADEVGRVTRQIGMLPASGLQVEVEAVSSRCSLQTLVHARIRLDGNHPGPGTVVAKVRARPGSELDDGRRRLVKDAPLHCAVLSIHVVVEPVQQPSVESASSGMVDHQRAWSEGRQRIRMRAITAKPMAPHQNTNDHLYRSANRRSIRISKPPMHSFSSLNRWSMRDADSANCLSKCAADSANRMSTRAADSANRLSVLATSASNRPSVRAAHASINSRSSERLASTCPIQLMRSSPLHPRGRDESCETVVRRWPWRHSNSF